MGCPFHNLMGLLFSLCNNPFHPFSCSLICLRACSQPSLHRVFAHPSSSRNVPWERLFSLLAYSSKHTCTRSGACRWTTSPACSCLRSIALTGTGRSCPDSWRPRVLQHWDGSHLSSSTGSLRNGKGDWTRRTRSWPHLGVIHSFP